jgi:ligand-binding SRPBCC domain-containing protein
MKYTHRFQVNASIEQVAAFHRHSASMGAITPPPIQVQIHAAPNLLNQGDEMDFTLWMGPVPIRWLALIEDVTATGFIDCQLRGPFKQWRHRHSFSALPGGSTEVLDEVEIKLASNWFWYLIGLGMWVSMPILFAYRGWKTRQLLHHSLSRESDQQKRA